MIKPSRRIGMNELIKLLVAGCLFAVGFTSLGLVQTAQAQDPLAFTDYIRSELDWYTIETENFLVHYHATENGEGSRTARVVARIAEDVYQPITELYDWAPESKVSFVLKDFEDYSNGAAYFFDNIIEIWAPALQTPFRGDHNWLRNVITHEFTHMVQVQKTMKASRKVPFFYLQYLDYEDVRRPDVLYGFPNIIASYAVPVLNNPAWFAEGTAQHQRSDLDYDRWDSHRDMLLRTQVLGGVEHDLVDMGGFYSHSSLMREGVYNHGFAFTRYIADRFGEEGLQAASSALGQWSNWNFKQASKDAFGVRGEIVYDDWMDGLRTYYAEHAPTPSDVEVLEADGFLNMYPAISPDGSQVAWVSNKGQDFSRTGIWLSVLGDESRAELILDDAHLGWHAGYTCGLGHRIVPTVSGSIDWTPDGSAIVYARTRDTREGFLVLDLYAYDTTTQKSTRLSRGLRASHPRIHPDGDRVAFIVQHDGTTNLAIAVLPDDASDVITPDEITLLTTFEDGTQILDPAWHPDGDRIAFSRARGHGRDLAEVDVASGEIRELLATSADERNPTYDADARLMYASDASGIFNLYRLDESGSVALTNEHGGAFMPAATPSGEVVFSRFEASGYTLARLDETEAVDPTPYYAPAYLTAFDAAPQGTAGEGVGETDVDAHVRAFTPTEFETEARTYTPVFTSFSFLPVLRLDQYVSRRRSQTDVRLRDRTRSETLWRNTKVGMYGATREIMGGMSFFGGLLVGPGSGDASSIGDFLSPSSLLDLERDAFLQVDYSRGLPFISGRWNPHFTAQVFNIRRQVENGLSIEEFPCTACFPEDTFSDLTYNLWEVDFRAKSKISRTLLAEAGYRYSPYRVKTNSFFSAELNQTVPSSSSRYFIGRAWTARVTFEAFKPHRDMNVLPEGLRAELEWDAEKGRLLDSFDIQDGILQPVYGRSTIHRLTFQARGGMRLGAWPTGGYHGIGYRLRASSILGGAEDDFYDDYVGGLTGARGYPFYALGGNETVWLQGSWIFPLSRKTHKQALFGYLDKVWMRVYADAAMAWSGPWPGLGDMRKDIGAEIRFGIGSFYLLPTALFASATYGLDEFEFQLDEGFVTPDGQRSVRYGNEVLWHVGLLFGFDQF